MRKAMKVAITSAAVVGALGGTMASAQAGTITWECSTDGGQTWETFVTAPSAAGHGLRTAQAATQHADDVLGEICRVTEN
jgi:hypothetical protein